MPTNLLQNSAKVDAVIPITFKDFGRFTILKQSLDRFCPNLLGTVWIVAPDTDVDKIRAQVQETNYHIISDSELIPEFNLFPKRGGWFNQQLIKIAIASKIQTDFYLTLDADIICVQPTSFSNLVKDGRAVYYKYPSENFAFPEWYEWAYRVLRLPNYSKKAYFNVTPSVLSRDAALQLQAYLTECSMMQLQAFLEANLRYRNGWLLLQAKLAQVLLPDKSVLKEQLLGWRAYLLRSIPWTEYSVYYTFCDAKGLLDQYHIQVDNCIYSTESSVWYQKDYSEWNPEAWFSGDRSFFFGVIQSTTKVNPNDIWGKVKPYLAE